MFTTLSEERIDVHSVADVSRGFIFKNEKQNRSEAPAKPNDKEAACINQIAQFTRTIRSHGNEQGKARAGTKESARKCLNVAFTTLTKAAQAKQKSSDNLWASISELADPVVELNLIDKDMPWFGRSLDEHQQESKRYINNTLSSAYCDKGSALWKSGKPREARQKYKRAVRFEPEPVMAVQIHYNWALSINAANNYFENQAPDKVYESLAEFLEMIAHYDEVIKQYAMITDDKFKKALKELDDRAKQMVQGAIDMENSHFGYSPAYPGQLIFKKGDQEMPLHITWTEYDLAPDDEGEMAPLESASSDRIT